MESTKAIIGLVIRYMAQWFVIAYLLITFVPRNWMKAVGVAIAWTILSIERRLNVGEKYR